MQKRQSDKISILIVPEGNAEPYSLRLNRSLVKGLIAVGFNGVAPVEALPEPAESC